MSTKKLHYISGIILSVFVGLHLFNHFISLFGAEQHIYLMDVLRQIYRNPIIETALLLAVLTQIISGIRLFFSKRKAVTSFFEKLQLQSGLYLAVFFVIHVGAVLSGRFILELDTNFYFGVAGLNIFPINLFFIPYYSLAILSFFGHIAAIHSQKMQQPIFKLSPNQQSKIILGIGIITTIVILYGLTNGVQGVNIPAEYNVVIGK
ncbi:MAG: hypothetical protein ACPG19_03415 [Saprospiraceae bacterium]